MQLNVFTKAFRKAALISLALGGFLCFAGASNARAEVYCPAARYDNLRVREAVRRHGFYSPQANYWRHERHEARERCWHR